MAPDYRKKRGRKRKEREKENIFDNSKKFTQFFFSLGYPPSDTHNGK